MTSSDKIKVKKSGKRVKTLLKKKVFKEKIIKGCRKGEKKNLFKKICKRKNIRITRILKMTRKLEVVLKSQKKILINKCLKILQH